MGQNEYAAVCYIKGHSTHKNSFKMIDATSNFIQVRKK